jgi:hypothetical protein
MSSIHHHPKQLNRGGVVGEREESVEPVLVAGGPSEETLTAAKSRLNCAAVSSLPLTALAVVTMQNGFISPSRSHWQKPCLTPCPVARAWAPSGQRPWCFPHAPFRSHCWTDEEAALPSKPKPTREIRSGAYPFDLLIWAIDHQTNGSGLMKPWAEPMNRHRLVHHRCGPIPPILQ